MTSAGHVALSLPFLSPSDVCIDFVGEPNPHGQRPKADQARTDRFPLGYCRYWRQWRRL